MKIDNKLNHLKMLVYFLDLKH